MKEPHKHTPTKVEVFLAKAVLVILVVIYSLMILGFLIGLLYIEPIMWAQFFPSQPVKEFIAKCQKLNNTPINTASIVDLGEFCLTPQSDGIPYEFSICNQEKIDFFLKNSAKRVVVYGPETELSQYGWQCVIDFLDKTFQSRPYYYYD